MSLQLSDINTKVRDLVASLLVMPAGTVRPANQNAPTGMLTDDLGNPKQWSTVLLSDVTSQGWDDRTFATSAVDANALTESISGARRLVASIQFFRGDAYSKACRLAALLQSDTATLYFQENGLGLIKVGDARNLTTIVDNYQEERGQLDVEFSCVSAETVTIDTYGSFAASVKTTDQTNSLEVTTK